MINKPTPQELGKELVESSAVAGAVKREADAFKRGLFTKYMEEYIQNIKNLRKKIKTIWDKE